MAVGAFGYHITFFMPEIQPENRHKKTAKPLRSYCFFSNRLVITILGFPTLVINQLVFGNAYLFQQLFRLRTKRFS